MNLIKNKLGVAINICNRIGISDDRCVEVINKADALMKNISQ